jgi:8-oxo-dGTP diphosphatase
LKKTAFDPEQYPYLFTETTWPWGPTRARFELRQEPPDPALIANVNIVPSYAGRWLMLRLADGAWEIPGGTLEPGESYLEAARRELREEAGALLHATQVIGAWRCRSLAVEPYRPHLPFPDFYRLVLLGEVSLDGMPGNPPGGEQVAFVELVTLAEAYERFAAQGRHDLAELYALAASRAYGTGE